MTATYLMIGFYSDTKQRVTDEIEADEGTQVEFLVPKNIMVVAVFDEEGQIVDGGGVIRPGGGMTLDELRAEEAAAATCPTCAGSGEGMHDGSNCSTCRGSGNNARPFGQPRTRSEPDE